MKPHGTEPQGPRLNTTELEQIAIRVQAGTFTQDDALRLVKEVRLSWEVEGYWLNRYRLLEQENARLVRLHRATRPY